MEILLAIVVAGGPDPTPSPEPPGATASVERFDLALVRTSGLDAHELRAELGLRIPELALRPHEQAGDLSTRTAPFIYIETKPKTPGLYAIAVIVSDGRAYYGEVDVGEDIRAERVVASTLANLIFSIEQGSVAPDREDATIPPTAPEPVSESVVDPGVRDPASPSVAATSPAAPTLEVGINTGIADALGLGPPRFADIYLGVGAALGVELRARSGFHAFASFRALGRTRNDHRLTRLRVALGAGYAWRTRNLEFVTALGVAVEPWLVSSTAGLERVTRPGGEPGRPPLLSAFVRLSPGYRVALDRGALRGLRIGPRLDVGGGLVPTDGGQVVGLRATDDTPLFRLGGAELATGFELALWFSRPDAAHTTAVHRPERISPAPSR